MANGCEQILLLLNAFYQVNQLYSSNCDAGERVAHQYLYPHSICQSLLRALYETCIIFWQSLQKNFSLRFLLKNFCSFMHFLSNFCCCVLLLFFFLIVRAVLLLNFLLYDIFERYLSLLQFILMCFISFFSSFFTAVMYFRTIVFVLFCLIVFLGFGQLHFFSCERFTSKYNFCTVAFLYNSIFELVLKYSFFCCILFYCNLFCGKVYFCCGVKSKK